MTPGVTPAAEPFTRLKAVLERRVLVFIGSSFLARQEQSRCATSNNTLLLAKANASSHFIDRTRR
jgi:hypothetical protein